MCLWKLERSFIESPLLPPCVSRDLNWDLQTWYQFTLRLQWLSPIQSQDTTLQPSQNENQILICLQWMFWKHIENQVTCYEAHRTEQQICGGVLSKTKGGSSEQSTEAVLDSGIQKIMTLSFKTRTYRSGKQYSKQLHFIFLLNHFKNNFWKKSVRITELSQRYYLEFLCCPHLISFISNLY